ncbi:hypothetical protein OEB99_18465 [Actinotalea sp. M2MS4P-6]|uniref:hypothetical protein n=1 Tax=Actinotalea sp. M2MS4P-6 TaxID=2983762 RepID=UPI0021E4EB98|nr:hypothetical protein [Actinotalea sp. M2MS4P-6]MCV2396299.1 hypothetical protein [Actinotalea sp. M2MS4P-6]
MSVDARLHVNPTGDLLEAAKDCEADVFLRWYGNTRAELDDEYGPYEDASVFLAVTDALGDVVAAMRLLVPGGSAGLKTLNDVAREPWQVDGARVAAAAALDLASTWEIATLTSRRQQAASQIRNAMTLYHGFGTVARVNAMSAFVAILDARVRRLLDQVGYVTRTLPGTRPGYYLGSESSVPVFANMATMVGLQRRDYPDSFALVTLGNGLDGVAVPTDEEFLVISRPDPIPSSWLSPGMLATV